MSKTTDRVKGRIKEAIASLTGNKDLKREGRADQTGAEAKSKVDDVKDNIEDVIDKTKDAVTTNTPNTDQVN